MQECTTIEEDIERTSRPQSHTTPASTSPSCATPALLLQLPSSASSETSNLALYPHLHSTQAPGQQSTTRSVASNQASESGQMLDFTDAGTPKVQFRQRRSLSLVSVQLSIVNSKLKIF